MGLSRRGGSVVVEPESVSWTEGPLTGRERTPHLARYARHPLPMGEGRHPMYSWCQPPPEEEDYHCLMRFGAMKPTLSPRADRYPYLRLDTGGECAV